MPRTKEMEETVQKRIETQKKKFLKALPDNFGIIESTAKEIGVSRVTIYNWAKNDPDFKEKVEEERELATSLIEKSMVQKGIEGKDTVAQIFLLKNRRPEVYGENKTININHTQEKITVVPAWIEDAEVVETLKLSEGDNVE